MASFSKRGAYWRAQIRRNGQPPQNATFDTKAQAETWARDVETRMDRCEFYDMSEAQRTTLHEALDRYYREVSTQKKHPAQELQRIKRWQANPLAKRFLATLRGHDFAKFRDDRRAAGRAENTVRLELQLISHLFGIARKEWGMEGLQNPIANIRKPGSGTARNRRLLSGEYDRIHATLSESGNPYAAPAFVLAIETSLRKGMLFELRWDWIDMQQRIIEIPLVYRGVGNKGVPVEIPLSNRAMGVLRSMPRALSGKVLGCTKDAVTTIWKRRLADLGIKGLRWHDLRHEAVSCFFEKGLHPLQVSSISGHKSLSMLARYTHLKAVDLVAMLG